MRLAVNLLSLSNTNQNSGTRHMDHNTKLHDIALFHVLKQWMIKIKYTKHYVIALLQVSMTVQHLFGHFLCCAYVALVHLGTKEKEFSTTLISIT